MDPNETLATLRRLTVLYREDGDWDEDETHMLVGLIEDLDEWLSKGGFLPAAWVRPEADSEADDMLDTIVAGNRAALEASGLESGWDDHPTFPRADWAAEIANGDTWLGYPQWVAFHEFDNEEDA